MKKLITLFLFLTAINRMEANGQDSLTLGKLRVNFVVPDMPAFKSLGTEPTNLLRPSTVQAIGLTVSEFYEDRKFLLPKALAVEISPSLLINAEKGRQGLMELREYARKAVINSLRFSIGTSTDTSLSLSGRNLSVGARISIINKGDLTTDTNYQKSVSDALKTFRISVRNVTLKRFAASKGINMTQVDWEDLIFSNPKMKAEFDVYLANEEEESQRGFLQELKRLKEEYRKRYWNATKLDFAAAILSSSPDSLVKNIRFNRVEMWLTWAQKAGKNGQFLLGVNASTYKNLLDTAKLTSNNTYSSFSIPARYLLGTNRVKGFAEAQYSYRGQYKEHSFFVNLGTELNITDGLWVNLYAGLDYNTTAGSTSFVSRFNLKLTLPENFSLF